MIKHLATALPGLVFSLLWTVFLASVPTVVRYAEVNIDTDLLRLDTVVDNSSRYTRLKNVGIDRIKRELALAGTGPLETFAAYRRLVQEYLKFNPDSAMAYARRAGEVAVRGGLDDERIEAEIYRVMVTVFCGDLNKAQRLLDGLGPIDGLPPSVRPQMAVVCMDYCIRSRNAAVSGLSGAVDADTKAVWMKYGRYVPADSWSHYYYKALLYDRSKTMLNAMLKWLDGRLPQPSAAAASMLYAVSLSYFEEGRHDLALHYLILSAINDIESANLDAQSLVSIVNNGGCRVGGNRAFKYLMLCTRNAYLYKDQGRSLNILAAHSKITKQFSDRLERRSMTLFVIVVLLGVALAVNCMLFFANVKKRRRQAELLAEIGEKNSILHKMIENGNRMRLELKAGNDSLKAEIALRNKNFIEVYRMITKYIEDEESFRKSLFNMITAGKTDKVRRELMSDSSVERYLQGFYGQFDRAFLISHPDFLDRFNALLRPECRIVPTETGRLTPELRIYALVAMGITDSVSIASFLHYSPQTIYNYRLKVRHGACIPEKNFAETVARLYS